MKPFKPDTNKWYVIVDWSGDGAWNDFAGPEFLIDYINSDGSRDSRKIDPRLTSYDTKEEAIAFMRSIVNNKAFWMQKLRVVSGKEIIVMLVKHRIRMASR